MYKAYINGRPLYIPGDELAIIREPVIKQALNDAGSFEFIVPDVNPEYENLEVRTSVVQVIKDNKEIFYGEINEIEKKIDKEKQVCAIGEMAFLFDTIQPQAVYQDKTPRQLLDSWIMIHNSKVDDKKKFYTGIVSVSGSNENISVNTNNETTLDCIREILCDRTHGYLRIRKNNGKRYLDLVDLKNYGKICEQPVRFGNNLLDYLENVSGSDIATACIPRGGRLEERAIEGMDAYTDITSVNEGKNYILLSEAVEQYGWICKVIDFEDIFIPSILKSKGEEWLASVQYENIALEVTAIDLSLLNSSLDSWELGDSVRAVAEPFGLDRYFPVNEKEIHLQNPEADSMKLGTTIKRGYVGQTQENKEYIKNELNKVHQTSSFLQSAIDNASQMLTGDKGGYKITEYDGNNRFLRELYMDAMNKEDAVNVMQIGPKGIGLSTQGVNGPYDDAWILGLGLNAKYIIAGTIKTEALSTEYRQTVTKEIEEAEKNAKKYAESTTETSINAMEDRISLKVSEEISYVMHDYCLNGKFDEDLSNWYVSNSTYVKIHYSNLGTCARFTGGSINAYLSQNWNLKKGKYKVRFKATSESGYQTTAIVRCEFNNEINRTPEGKLESGVWNQFEYEFYVPQDGVKYLFFYNDSPGSPIWITDVQVLGGYEEYNEAQIKVLGDSISSMVSKDDVGSYVGQYYDRVITAFNDDSRYIQITAGEIAVYDDGAELSNKRASFDESGINFWRDGYNLGYIGASSLRINNYYKGLVFNLETWGKFMAWGYLENPSDNYYNMMLYFFTKANISDNPYPGIYLGHDMYANGYTISLDSEGRTWTVGYSNGAGICTRDTFWIQSGNEDTIAQFDNSEIILVRDTYANVVGTPSDERLKENIFDSKINALQILSELEFREFDWIESKEHEQLGLVAQEVEQIEPELVKENSEGIKYINPTRLLWYCAKSIQQLSHMMTPNEAEKPVKKYYKGKKFTVDEKKEWIAERKENNRPIKGKTHKLKVPVEHKGGMKYE
ncbi:hypothetical protein C3B58_11655 [Lactonifactor longoviformis]|uniref:Chaperone of endosialidase n=1 Tax=Lactonifactor longoviformis DSM 17459 TaxID=1122155 RepID=A0A1M4TQA8_9CLOT|nr:phage tail spike protein [Lactonifactor longoviformis]POP32504.1 hypothetical protein C3B58_11655 [Lactonifactor longoviformis]SHE46618.1 Chaperone of endosialidase [Lactonifactor longoviformis DSM 17459]